MEITFTSSLKQNVINYLKRAKDGLACVEITHKLNVGKPEKYHYNHSSIATTITRLVKEGIVEVHDTRKGKIGGKIYVLNKEYIEWQKSLNN